MEQTYTKNLAAKTRLLLPAGEREGETGMMEYAPVPWHTCVFFNMSMCLLQNRRWPRQTQVRGLNKLEIGPVHVKMRHLAVRCLHLP